VRAAGRGLAPLLLALLTLLTLLTPVGGEGAARAADVKLATWDFGWLTVRPAAEAALPDRIPAKQPQDIARLARYAAALKADIVAVQGVDGPAVLGGVFAPAAYDLVLSDDPVLQRSGFAIRRAAAMAVVRNPDLTALNPYGAAPFPLRSGADVTVRLSGGARLRLLSVHLKSGCRDAPLDDATRPACATLARQAEVLAGWIAARERDGAAFAVLGDFGRVMEGSDPFLATLTRAGQLLRPTAGQASPCWGGGDFVDHVLLGGPARGWLVPGSLRVMVYRETEGAWRARLSDHCPVSIRLHVPD
jgi:endonuclease/exonuclease/phosphatase family metal-dependent hydrolase